MTKKWILMWLVSILLFSLSLNCLGADDPYDDYFGKYYKLEVEHSGYVKVASIADPNFYGDGNNIHEREYVVGDDTQQFLLIPADENCNHYYIMSRHDGRCMDAAADGSGNIHSIRIHGGDNQKWAISPVGGDYFNLISKYSGKCADAGGKDGNICQWELILGSGVPQQKWKLVEVDNLDLPELQDPECTSGNIYGDVPKLKGFDEVPQSSTPKLLKEVFIPFIAVKDPRYSDPSNQIQRDPYYILRTELFWELASVKPLSGLGEQTEKTTVTTGISFEDIKSYETTINVNHAAEAHLDINVKDVVNVGGSYSFGYGEESRTGGQSTRTNNYESVTEKEFKYPAGAKMREALYILVNRQTVLRTSDGTKVGSWEVKTTTFDYSSAKEESTEESTGSANQKPTAISIKPDKTSPQNVGTPITFEAIATDPDGDTLQYEFWVNGPGTGNEWEIGQYWSTDSLWTWTPTASDVGSSLIQFEVKDGKHLENRYDDSKEIYFEVNY